LRCIVSALSPENRFPESAAATSGQARFFFCDLRRAIAIPSKPTPAIKNDPLIGLSPGAAAQDADACPWASAEHSPPSQLALALPETWMCKYDSSELMQSSRLLAFTNWPSQKSAPFGVVQAAVHPPVICPSQLASPVDWQLMLQVAFTSAVQDPLHELWHCAVQEADGGVPLHFA
jgi:hypothetical protein